MGGELSYACRIFSILDFYPLDASSTHPPPPLVTTQNVSRYCEILPGREGAKLSPAEKHWGNTNCYNRDSKSCKRLGKREVHFAPSMPGQESRSMSHLSFTRILEDPASDLAFFNEVFQYSLAFPS